MDTKLEGKQAYTVSRGVKAALKVGYQTGQRRRVGKIRDDTYAHMLIRMEREIRAMSLILNCVHIPVKSNPLSQV